MILHKKEEWPKNQFGSWCYSQPKILPIMRSKTGGDKAGVVHFKSLGKDFLSEITTISFSVVIQTGLLDSCDRTQDVFRFLEESHLWLPVIFGSRKLDLAHSDIIFGESLNNVEPSLTSHRSFYFIVESDQGWTFWPILSDIYLFLIQIYMAKVTCFGYHQWLQAIFGLSLPSCSFVITRNISLYFYLF